jgi:hypothetical protein
MAIKDWHGVAQMVQCSWTCGHCGLMVGGNMGYYKGAGKKPQDPRMAQFALAAFQQYGVMPPLPAEEITDQFPRIIICPNCEKPTFFGNRSTLR